MATTIHLELKKSPTSKGEFPIFIRITKDRRSTRVRTSIALKSISDWNPKGEKNDNWVRTSESKHQSYNQTLRDELDAVKETHKGNKDASPERLKELHKQEEVSESFLDYAKKKVEEAGAIQSIGTYRHYKSTIQHFEGFLASRNRKDIAFNEINLALVKAFEAYLSRVENGREKGRKLDTITKANYLKKFRKVVNEAVAEGHIKTSPFGKESGKFSIKQGQDKTKEKLELEEVEQIIALDLPEGSALWNTRNAFLFSFFCAGIRAGDLLQLRWKNVEGGRLHYTMDKNGKVREFEMVEDAKKILSLYWKEGVKGTDYIFPFLSSSAKWAIDSERGKGTMSPDLQRELFLAVASRNVILNRNLKHIAELAGVDKKVNFHTSRHTFAHLAMESGIESKKIQGLLAHSSLSTTENYMGQFSNKEESEALAKVFKSAKESPKNALITALRELDKETLAEVLKSLEMDK